DRRPRRGVVLVRRQRAGGARGPHPAVAVAMTFKPRSAVVWFAVGGGPLAFALQFVSGLAFTFAQCNQPDGRWQLPVRSWQLALAAAALVIGLASMATAVWLFVRT